MACTDIGTVGTAYRMHQMAKHKGWAEDTPLGEQKYSRQAPFALYQHQALALPPLSIIDSHLKQR